MATLNQFQQYSQSENTVTNNVLLMLSNLYEINPKFYEDFIRGLTEDANTYEIIPRFVQQVGYKSDNVSDRSNGFVDGQIQMRASKIIIETKLKGLESIGKLLKYTKRYDENEHKILVHLSTNRYSKSEIEDINEKIKERRLKGNVNFYSLTYSDIVENLNELSRDHIYEPYLQRLNEHFKEYCLKMKLMPETNHLLRIMACGGSFALNEKHQFYFDSASRGYRDFNYLGLYARKSVRYIGEIENVVVADWDENGQLIIKDEKYKVTEEQKLRLRRAIEEANSLGWDLKTGHRFFLLKNFTETDFQKDSPGGIYRVRYFNIEDYFGKSPGDIAEIGQKLRNETWK